MIGQSMAWISMIRDRAPEQGLQASVADTFSGENPCRICVALQEERDKQREETPIPEASPLTKIVPIHSSETRLAVFPPPPARRKHPRSQIGSDLWQTEVPSPPPWLG